MLRNPDISNLMSAIVGKIMPLCAKDANPELWLIYNEMQEWKILVENTIPLTNTNEPEEVAKAIKAHLNKLTDRMLAQAIERVLIRYTPQSCAATALN